MSLLTAKKTKTAFFIIKVYNVLYYIAFVQAGTKKNKLSSSNWLIICNILL